MKKTAIILVVMVMAITLSGCIKINNDQNDGDFTQEEIKTLAQCLTDKGVKMYGAVWCGHCSTQKKMFGDAFQYVNYIECDANTNIETARICVSENISGVPAWDFADGTRKTGVLQFSELAELAGC